MRMTRFALLVLLALQWLSAKAQDEMMDNGDETKRCLSLATIRSIDILDDQHLIFHTTGNKQYLNTLPHRCGTMNKHSTIMYSTSLSELCDLDTITVLETMGGGFMRGPSCGLGKFEPINDTQLESLRSEMKPVQQTD